MSSRRRKAQACMWEMTWCERGEGENNKQKSNHRGEWWAVIVWLHESSQNLFDRRVVIKKA